MNLLQKIRDFLFGTPAPEVITGRFVGQPKDYPDGRPENHTEHIDHIGVQPGSKI